MFRELITALYATPNVSQPAALPGLRKMGHQSRFRQQQRKSNFTVLTFYLWWWWGAGKPYDASAEIIQEGFLSEEPGSVLKREKGSSNLRLNRRLSTGKTKLISCLNARGCEDSVYPLCGWSVLLCKLPMDPWKIGLCCPGWGTDTAFSLGRRQPKPWGVEAEVKGKSGGGLGDRGPQARSQAHKLSWSLDCPPIELSSSCSTLTRPTASTHKPFSRRCFESPSCLNWRQLFFLLSGKRRKSPHSPFPLSSPLLPLCVEKLFISKQRWG